MMGNTSLVCMPPFLLISAAACGGYDGATAEPARLGAAANALLDENALNPNALNPNALNPNALNPNALALNVLSEPGLAPSALAAIRDPGEVGVLSRALLRYVVGCALGETQAFNFSWTDALGVVHDERYPGLMGLATSWIEDSLPSARQQWVSACVASRVNWHGVSVVISSRGSDAAIKHPSELELSSYTKEEGVFWGNLFANSPTVFACYNQHNVANSRSLFRDCAAGHLNQAGGVEECGIIRIVGRCEDRCEPLHPVGRYRPSCADSSGVWSSKVMTTFLP
jgi:hypothetical protein